jgi:stearoyl-CoA desaturase (delta-9 desaturase)
MTKTSIDSVRLLVLQAIAHVGFLYLLFTGSWFEWFIVFSVYFITGCFGITVTYHRLLSHKSWKAPTWWVYFGSLCGFYGVVGSPIAWVATHRAHHRDPDGPKDPHSPIHRTWWSVQWLSMFEEVNVRYAVDLLRSPFQLFLHKHYFAIHGLFVILMSMISMHWLVVLYLAPAALLWNAGSSINTVSHLFGYRNTETKDNSRCNFTLGYFVWGEGWHNNHHATPASASFQKKWWELDIGYQVIRLVRTDANT